MKKILFAAFLSLVIAVGCKESGNVEKMEDAKKLSAPTQYFDKISYGIGQQIGRQMRMDTSIKINVDYLIRGYLDGLDSTFTGDQDTIAAAMQKYQQDMMMHQKAMQEQFQKDMEAKGNKLKEEGPKFCESFKAKGNVVETPSGLLYKVIKKGNGKIPTDTNWVRIHVIGKLSDGTEFDDTYKKNKPLEIPVMGIFPGLSQGLKLMPVGSTFEFCIPDSLAFDGHGAGNIPPNAVLDMQVELVDIIPAPQRQPMMGGPGGPGGPGMPPPPMPRRK